MLVSLTVKNFAIIENISMDFKNGFTVLTGETGAGKSLLIDAIGLLFGDRAQSDAVRYEETKATIEGVFSDYSKEVNEILEENSIEINDFLIIKREVYQNGKSIAKVNGEAVNLNVLDAISTYLGDIHTQFDVVKLVNPKNYFSFIDDDAINTILDNYKVNLKEYRKFNKLYQDKLNEESLNNQKIDFLKYQIQELEKAKLSVGEEETLKNEVKLMENHEKIMENFEEFTDFYENNDIDSSLFNALNALKRNLNYDESLKDKIDRLESSYYEINDVYEDIIKIKRSLDFNPNEFEEKNERLSIYSSLKRKYKMTTSELIDYLDEKKKEVNDIENFDQILSELNKEKEKYFKETKKLALDISRLRKENAITLKDNLVKVFPDLSLKNTSFDIVITDGDDFYPNGINQIDFMISFNKGEPLKPLNKVASGGELSRFMLAIKAVSCNKVMNKTFIFDEIDSGVSGEVAFNIARKIKEISTKNQVLCVTHLPQVASLADIHYNIEKVVFDDNRTRTSVNALDYDGRVTNIALMISKGNLTDASIALAKEFLK